MPQKNEGKDVPFLMQMSKEFNPIISFDVNSMEHSGSNITSSYHDYSAHNRNNSQSSAGGRHFLPFRTSVPYEVIEQNEETLLHIDDEEEY
jgi:hypothetical protein